MRRFAVRLVPIAIAAIVLWFQFASSEKFTNEAGRATHLALSPAQEETLGLQSYQQVLSERSLTQAAIVKALLTII